MINDAALIILNHGLIATDKKSVFYPTVIYQRKHPSK